MRTGKPQKGRFSVEPGMAFRMKDLDEMLPNGKEFGAGNHPWLITRVDDNYVEMVMCRTLASSIESKHVMHKLDFDDVEDITNPCPPMESGQGRTQAFCMDKFRIFPKKELFTHKLSILNDNNKKRNFETEGHESLCMDQESLKYIRKKCLAYSHNLPEYMIDPYGIQDAEYALEDTPDDELEAVQRVFNDKYGWSAIRQADTRAVYPFEDQMRPYEEADKVLVATVRERDKRKFALSKDDVNSIPVSISQIESTM